MKKVKFILPMLAFLFAIVASVATISSAKVPVTSKLVSPKLMPDNTCVNIGSCTVEGTTACTVPADFATVAYRNKPVKEYILATGLCGSDVNGTWEED